MSKGKVLFVAGIALFLVVGVVWAKQGGLASLYQEGNTQEWTDSPAQLVSSSLCQGCHPGVYDGWAASEHRSVNCQTCHGPAVEHVQGKGKLIIDTSQELCGLCHNRTIGRRADFPQVDLKEHAGQSACILCHQPHAPGLAGAKGR